jgi:hypothetical protein
MKTGFVAVMVAVVGALAAGSAYAGVVGTPVRAPEPMSLTLLGLGAGAVAVGAWWRNRK